MTESTFWGDSWLGSPAFYGGLFFCRFAVWRGAGDGLNRDSSLLAGRKSFMEWQSMNME